MSKFFFLVFLLLNLLIPCQCLTQTILKLPFEKKIGPDNGLSNYNASKILEDKYGFIWIATLDGLNRYNGNAFTVYNKSTAANHRLLGNVINDMLEDTARNILWVTTSYGGVNGIDLITGNISHALNCVINDSSFHNGWLKCFNICDGNLWIGSSDGLTVYNPSLKRFIYPELLPFKKKNKDDQLNINAVITDQYKHVWIFLPDHGIVVYSGITNKILHYFTCGELGINESKGYAQFLCRFVNVNASTYMLGTDHGFNFLGYDSSGNIWRQHRSEYINKITGNQEIISCTHDNDGTIWFSTFENLYKYDPKNNSYQIINDIGKQEKGNWVNQVLYILFDGQNNLWLGTGKGVTFSRNNTNQLPFIPFTQSKDALIKIERTNFVFPFNDSLIYACAVDGVYEVRTNRNDTNNIQKIDSRYALHAFKNIDQRMIVSLGEGVFVYSSGKLIPAKNIYPELSTLSGESVNSSLILGDSVIIMGSETGKGIYVWHVKRHQLINLQMNEGQVENSPLNYIYQAQDNKIWVLFDNSIAVMNPDNYTYKRFQLIDPELKIPMSIFFDVCEMNDYYWLAVHGKGVVQLDKNLKVEKFYSLDNGISNTGVYKVLPYADSLIFTTSNNGLYCINVKSEKIIQFLEDDGLNTNYFEERCGYLRNGIIYAGGINGFSIINPLFVGHYSSVPALYIDRITLQIPGNNSFDTSNLHFQHYNIKSEVVQATVSFSGINYKSPSRVSYAYRIKELNEDWINLGLQNFVDLIGFSPGAYTLEVKAANENGNWCEPKTLILTFEPKWFQTWFFKALVVIILLSLIYGFFRYRLMQIRKQHQIRKEIASDLHDDIGATINSVKIFAHLAETSEEKKKYFTHIRESLTQASAGLRDMIWVLDDKGDTAGDLFNRLQMFARPVTEASGVKISFNIDDTGANILLNKTEKRNLLLIAKEAINNSIKYAACENITVTFSKPRNKTTLVIHDDGKGFSDSKIIPGNGLQNMRERAHQVHYNILIESEDGIGTKITLAKK